MNKKVGNKEVEPLKEKPVTIVGVAAESVLGKKGSKNEGKEVGKKLVVICKHPDKEEPIRISEMKFVKGDSIKTSTIWINLDDEGNIQKGSMVVILLDSMKAEILKDLEGKKIDTIYDLNKYLCLRCY